MLVLRALLVPKEPLVLLVKKGKEVPVESLVALCPRDPKASRSGAKPSLMMVQKN